MNHYTIKITKEARDDLKKIKEYLIYNLQELETVKNVIKKIKESIKSLSDYPKRFPIINDAYFSIRNLRKYNVNNYIIFYFVEERKMIVHIIRIIYAKTNWMKNI